jgi:hypothetical protein
MLRVADRDVTRTRAADDEDAAIVQRGRRVVLSRD